MESDHIETLHQNKNLDFYSETDDRLFFFSIVTKREIESLRS